MLLFRASAIETLSFDPSLGARASWEKVVFFCVHLGATRVGFCYGNAGSIMAEGLRFQGLILGRAQQEAQTAWKLRY